MQNRWFANGRAPTLNHAPPAPGEDLLPPPLVPPYPPDPTSLSISHFPPLSVPNPKKPRSPPQTPLSKKPVEKSFGLVKTATTAADKAQSTKNSAAMTSTGNAVPPKPQITVHGSKPKREKPTTEIAEVTQLSPPDVEMPQVDTDPPTSTSSPSPDVDSENTVPKTLTQEKAYTIIPPKSCSPIETNKAGNLSNLN
ncbi:unnamed protein product [Microthlaspi erraticum]|uniref:Uncharacterized protein n=1 Tax=Microthlaspi erraticum TaxID=1685480 RepID=A0A6D2KLJ5_9BRAS|nr:unnamed protein product [Microthlaspi erraticum]